jgi:hypothetical protein
MHPRGSHHQPKPNQIRLELLLPLCLPCLPVRPYLSLQLMQRQLLQLLLQMDQRLHLMLFGRLLMLHRQQHQPYLPFLVA